MKTPYVILLLFAFTFGAYAQQQTSTLPPMQLWESVAYKTSTIDWTTVTDGANNTAIAVLDTTVNTDTLKLSLDLIGRGEKVNFTLRLANAGDSIRFQQYDWLIPAWVDAPASYLTNRPNRANGASWQLRDQVDDTTSVIITGLGFFYTGVTYDISIRNRTNGDIRMLRGVQDTGVVKITYVLEGKL